MSKNKQTKTSLKKEQSNGRGSKPVSVNRKKMTSSSKKQKQQKIRHKKLIKKQKRVRLAKELMLAVTLLLVLLYLQSLFFFSFAKVNSYAMSPTLKMGEYVFIDKNARIQRQDILLIKRENARTIEMKRVIGLPSENVEYKEDQLYINGVERSEPYLAAEKTSAANSDFLYTKDFTLFGLMGTTELPADRYFVLGDNRLYSTDSRDYGTIKKSEIIGIVSFQF
ncbi:hypothetical protein ATZ33_15260 [Enterococcus silesiacus]|uniref:Signal peptidase I n=1 Tax=Enterococcus silesiacus TaxID=332949 RepID=A0A0S3KEH9_9ENTE|nr:signal peptidase I [Enterococcus silesiacus]ALS02685.1 hypothetical protein ATZ33_15260 [Enterococcus silesiacus]OJG89766.1 hypothetical protein RV15_GL001607 [Enterococcus silesiacus]